MGALDVNHDWLDDSYDIGSSSTESSQSSDIHEESDSESIKEESVAKLSVMEKVKLIQNETVFERPCVTFEDLQERNRQSFA